MSSRHESDEFDRAARQRTIVGAHRRERSGLRRALPVVLVVLLAPLAAWALFTFVVRSGVLPAPSELVAGTAGQTATPGASGTAAGGSGAASGTAAPADVRPDTAITVLDGSATGAAGQDAADHLEDAGYRQIRVGEYGASEPAATTVYYRDADVADTAQDVAARVERATGTTVSEVLESATAASSAPVVVVLRD